jgi:hypothetical protein
MLSFVRKSQFKDVGTKNGRPKNARTCSNSSPMVSLFALKSPRLMAGLSCLLASALLPLCAPAGQLAQLELSAPVAASRGPHHTIWERTYNETGPKGRVIEKKRYYTEIATGLNRWSATEGKFVPSSEEFEIVNGAAIARKGAHVLSLAPNLNVPGSVEVTMPDGQHLRSTVAGIAVWDQASGQSEFIAQLKDVGGRIINPRETLYEDAFTGFGQNSGLHAHILYHYSLRGMEQDVIVSDQIVLPAGFSPATTEIQIWTEFFDAPNPQQHQRMLDGVPDLTLQFGKMRIMPGRAFSIEGAPGWSSPVAKQWVQVGTRRFLVERLKWQAIQPAMRPLPLPKGQASVKAPTVGEVVRLNDDQSILVPPAVSPTAGGSPRTITMAALSPTPQGLVIDYSLVTVDTLTLLSDQTYYVSEPVVVDNLTVEGNTVVKYEIGASIEVAPGGILTTKTGPYREAVFTAVDDNTCGEPLGYNEIESYYASPAFILHDANHTVRYVRVSYAEQVFNLDDGIVTLEHSQIAYCGSVMVQTAGSWGGYFNNVLLAHVGSVLSSSGNAHVIAQHITVDGCNVFTDCSASSTLTVVNSIVANLSSWGAGTLTQYCVPTATDSDFQTAVGGAHYLAWDSLIRNTASGTISNSLRAEIKTKTTCPPVVYADSSFFTDTIFPPAACPDSAVLDPGFHYDVLDYAFGGVDGYANLTFAPGVAVGWFRTSSGWYHAGHGIHMGDQKILTFNGTAEAPDYWVRCNVVQEGGTGIGEGGYGPGGITGWANQSLEDVSLSPEIHARFTRFSMLVADMCHCRDDWGYLILRATDCEFYSGNVGGYVTSCYLTNCLFDRVYLAQVAGLPGNEVHVRNCTWNGGLVQFSRWYQSPPILVTIQDCAFEQTAFSLDTNGNTIFDYNAYVAGAPQLSPAGTHDLTPVSSFNWESDSLGNNYYLPTGSPLIDQGSRSALDAELECHTTKADQAPDTGVVDIGLHHFIGSPRAIYEKAISNQSPNFWFRLDGSTWNSANGGQNLAIPATPTGLTGGYFDTNLFDIFNKSFGLGANTDVRTPVDTLSGASIDVINGGNPGGGVVDDQTATGSVSLLFRTLGPSPQDKKRYVLSQGSSTRGSKNAFHLYFAKADGNYELRLEIGNAQASLLSLTQIVPDAWYYLGITWQLDRNPEVKWYLGRLGDALNDPPGTIELSETPLHAVVGDNGPLYLGNKRDADSGDFANAFEEVSEGIHYKGRLDEIAFWNSELTADQIKAQFNALPPVWLPANFNWNLMLPVNDAGQLVPNDPPHVVEHSQLNAGFQYRDPADNTKKYFYRSTGGTMVFEAPWDGADTDTNYNSPRSELRETKADGRENNWPAYDSGTGIGTHTLQGSCRVISGDSKVIIGQIHTDTPEFDFEIDGVTNHYKGIPAIVLSYGPSTHVITVTVKHSPIDPSTNADTAYDFPTEVLKGDLINYSLQLVATENSVKLYARVNDEEPLDENDEPQDYVDMYAWNTLWADVDTKFYFKAGAYYPKNSGTGTAKVTFSSLTATHTVTTP